MSAEAVSQNGTAPADKNAQASADVNDMLAQLQAKKEVAAPNSETAEKSDDKVANKSEETNGASEKKEEDNTYRGERRERERSRERHGGRDNRGSFRGRGRGRGNFRDNNKTRENRNLFDPSTLEESDDPVAIRKQVEFYFSDSNLPLDKFLLTQVGGNENKPVELETICSFKRMRHFKPRSAVVAALKESTFLDVVEDDTKIQRKVPLSTELANTDNETVVKVFEDRAMPRSVYVKGFGEEQPSTQFDIEAFFTPYGPTNAIRLRRKDTDKSFKGSAFVEFDSEETMKKFLDLEPKPEYKGTKLQVMTKKEYCNRKAADIASGKIRASSPRRTPMKRSRDDDRDWRDRRRDDHDGGDRRGGNRCGRGGRGGRGRGDQDRGDRDRGDRRDRNRERENDSKSREAANDDAVAKAKAFVEAEKSATDQDAGGQKRSREEDTSVPADGEREAKKVDVKE